MYLFFWQCKCSRLQLGVLVDSEEKDVIGLVVVDEEEEGVVGDEVGVEERSGRTEAEEGGGGRGLAALLVDVDEGLVNGAGERHLNGVAMFGVDEVGQVAFGGIEQGLQAEFRQRGGEFEGLLDLELGELHVQIVHFVKAGSGK